jgi:hypothetical protein
MRFFIFGIAFISAELILQHIPPMPDIDQIQTDEEWHAMMEEYEAVMVLRGKIARGEVSLEDALKVDEVAAAPAVGGVAEVGVADGDDPMAAREAAVGNKVDDMLNASSDEEWNKMMEAYNKALQANPV